MQQGLPALLEVGQRVFHRQHWRPLVEYGVGLDGELVPAQVGRLIAQSDAQILAGGLCTLSLRAPSLCVLALCAAARQAVHQVDIEALETRGAHGVEDAQLFVVKGLYAQRQAVDTGGAKAGEFFRLGAAGAGLQIGHPCAPNSRLCQASCTGCLMLPFLKIISGLERAMPPRTSRRLAKSP
ncbi:MAG: hypothetical protein ACK5HY_04600 [Parahaliea sp.]